ncbi:MAG: hypothetical protein KZQ92_09515 [Candidatus Thiodiazotropha sp. (ex Lucinoma borealis)]|nr:hypothetical protein [Candidatus Thiodiazotropha sp. (ex Lucinoma borealis)]
MNFQTFWYNLGWSDWVTYIDGWIPKLSLSVPIIGYLILFNDAVGNLMQFDLLIGGQGSEWGMSTGWRLRSIYFALILLGLSNFIYHVKKPYIFRFGKNIQDFARNCLKLFTFGNFQSIHLQIRESDPFTSDGKYYDSEWDGFKKAALNEGEGTDSVEYTGNWELAKSKYGSLLRSILNEHFFRGNQLNRAWLVVCITLSSLGYAMLILPSMDLLLKVIWSSVIN